MNPTLNGAVIAALVAVSLIQFVALRRKWKQAENFRALAMFGVIQVTKLKAETRKIIGAANEALNAAEAVILNLTTQVEELREEDQDSRIDDLETTVGKLVAEREGNSPTIRFPFGSPGPFAGERPIIDPLEALLGTIGRNADVGARGVRSPSIQAFKITPGGLMPVSGPEDFGLRGPARPSAPPSAPSIADILSLLATRDRPRGVVVDPLAGLEAIFGTKADISGSQEPQTASQGPQTASQATTAFPPNQSPRAG